MKVIDLLKQVDPEKIYPNLHVSLALNKEDSKRQHDAFIKAFHKLTQEPAYYEDKGYLVFVYSGTYYEAPVAVALEAFMFRRDDIKDFKVYNQLESFMLEDKKRNERIARTTGQAAKKLIDETPFPASQYMKMMPWNDVLGAEIVPGLGDYSDELAASCILDLMMSYDVDEEKSHQSCQKIDEENRHNPMTLTSRRKKALARHLYDYKVLQILAHRVEDGTL